MVGGLALGEGVALRRTDWRQGHRVPRGALHRAIGEVLEHRLLLSTNQFLRIPISNPDVDNSPYAPVTVQQSDLVRAPAAQVVAPTSFDLRTAGGVTSVKDQGACGSCWAFATYGSAESAALVAGAATLDLSENNLKDWHGFDYTPCQGGSSRISEAYLSRGSGPVSEVLDPYHDWDDRGSANPEYPRSNWITQMLRFDTTDEIKNAVMNLGGLYTTMGWLDSCYRASDNTYYSTSFGTSHGVTIVGWDDSRATPASTPGAWLIKNSWGSGWGDSGYFWLSYADRTGAKTAEWFGGVLPAATYDNAYYWDPFGQVDTIDAPWAMNRFVAAGDETLSAVGFYTQADNASYTLTIYDSLAGGVPTNPLISTAGTQATAGWHTVSLPSPVTLSAGNDFYVVLSIVNGGHYPQGCEYRYAGYDSASTASPNQSWYSYDGSSWTDLTTWNATANFCLKAYTVSGTRAPIYSANMDSNPGWSATGQWQWGHPTGQGGSAYGCPDPANGYTGSNVYGVNLAGDYSTGAGGPWYLTTQAIDCSKYSNVQLQFQRWLNTDSSPSAQATVAVSSDGTNWTSLYANGSTRPVKDGIWSLQSYDISSVADRKSTVYVRWGYQIAGSNAHPYSGWNIDDVIVTGVPVEQSNSAPTDITLSKSSVAENQPAGTTVGTFSATDPDPGETFTYTLVSGTGGGDNGSFTIGGDQLQTNASFNYEARNSYSIRVQVTDSGGLSFQKVFTIRVTNVNEAPTAIALSKSSVAENQPANTVVGTFSTTDPDVGDTFSYSLVSGSGSANNGSFTISGNQLLTRSSFDYEVKSSYSIRVQVTDSGGLSYQKAFTIRVTNVNEPPTSISLDNATVAENQPVNTTVGCFSASDPDAGEAFTYALASGTGDGDNGSFTINGNQLRTAASFNYEARNSYSIRVQVTDSGGLSFQKVFTISVTNLREASVAGRYLFYNSSAFDGNNAAANASDDAAIATDKQALLPGQTATFANYSSYSRGINGLMLDLAAFSGTLTASDFLFTVGNSSTPSSWLPAPAPTTIAQRPLPGGITRVSLIWADNAIQKQWLQVTLTASDHSDLAQDDLFYFGNAIGETGNSPANAIVDATDEIGARNHPQFLPPAMITNVYDFNRDKQVNATDQILARNNRTFLDALKLIAAPAATGSAGGAATVGPASNLQIASRQTQANTSTMDESANRPVSQASAPMALPAASACGLGMAASLLFSQAPIHPAFERQDTRSNPPSALLT